MASIGLINTISAHSWCESEHFHILVSRLPSLNDCMVTKQNVLDRSMLFWFKFCHILSTAGFINEDNYCHSQRIGQLIKGKLLKGIFKVDWLIILHVCFLGFFFSEIMLECWGAAYTRVRLIHESLQYVLGSWRRKHATQCNWAWMREHRLFWFRR